MSREDIVEYMTDEIAVSLNKEPKEIDVDTNFMKMGISSVQALKIINKLRKKLNIDIYPVAMFEYKTVSEFANYLVSL